MSFTNNVEAIGSSDNTFHTVATGYEASVHALLIDNPSGSSETITIKIKNNVTGTTVNSVVIAVGANSSYIYPRPINLAQQDELILVSTGTAAIGTSSTYTQLMSGVPSAITLSAKGAWASGTTYSALDIVSYSGGSWIALRVSVGVTPVAGADWGINASQGPAGNLSHVVDDTSPQLGGNLALGSFDIPVSPTQQTALNLKFPAPVLTATSLTAVKNNYYTATVGGITITLPASPSVGDYLAIKDGTGAAATTTFTVARNGSNIASSATDLTFDKNFADIVMTYVDGTIGWSV